MHTVAQTHTCSELSLRILIWSASDMQKQTSYTWQEWMKSGDWKLALPFRVPNRTRKKLVEETSSNTGVSTKVLNWAIKRWTEKPCWSKLESIQIVETTQKSCSKYRQGGSWLGSMPYTDKCRYVSAGWAVISHPLGAVFVRSGTPPRDPHPPAKLRSLTSLQMVHAHGPQQRSFLRLRQMRWRWRWKGNGHEMTMEIRWQLLNRGRNGERKRGKEKGKHQHQHT